jgi:hypothetical protein
MACSHEWTSSRHVFGGVPTPEHATLHALLGTVFCVSVHLYTWHLGGMCSMPWHAVGLRLNK